MYEGGRQGAVRDYNEDIDDDGDGNSLERERRAKRESEDLIKRQFALRRTESISRESDEEVVSSKVRAAASTTLKVTGLTVQVRERNVDLLTEALQKNYDSCKPKEFEHNFNSRDVEDVAINMEYEIFTTKTNMTMYRSSIAKLMSLVKKNTQSREFQPEFSNHKLIKHESRKIKELFYSMARNERVDKRAREERGFQSAKELLDSRALKKLKLSSKSQPAISHYFKKTEVPKREETPPLPDDEDPPKPVPPPEMQPSEIPPVTDYIKSHDAVIKKGNKRQYVSSADLIDNIKSDQTHLNNGDEERMETNEEEKCSKNGGKNKQQIGQFIVQLLMPAYSLKRFQSKESFKSVARKITHDVIGKGIEGNATFSWKVSFIYVFFFLQGKKISRSTSVSLLKNTRF